MFLAHAIITVPVLLANLLASAFASHFPRIFAERKAKDSKGREVKTNDVKPRDSQSLELIRPPEGYQKPPDTVFSASGHQKDDVDLEAAF